MKKFKEKKKKEEKVESVLEVNDSDRENIAEQIKQGYTSGLMEGFDEKNRSVRVSWEIKINKFR